MNSVTARVVALAISTLGIVFSDNEAVTRLEKDQSELESVVASAPDKQPSIVRLVDISTEPTVQMLPLVNDKVEELPAVMSADQFWDIVRFKKKPGKSELRIASPAGSDEDSMGGIAFTKRLPAVETEALDAPQRVDTSLAKVPWMPKQEYRLNVPQSFPKPTRSSAQDAALFYRQHAAKAKVIEPFSSPASKSVEPTRPEGNSETERRDPAPAVVRRAVGPTAVSPTEAPSTEAPFAAVSKQRPETTPSLVDRRQFKFTRLPLAPRQSPLGPADLPQPIELEPADEPEIDLTPELAKIPKAEPPPIVSQPAVTHNRPGERPDSKSVIVPQPGQHEATVEGQIDAPARDMTARAESPSKLATSDAPVGTPTIPPANGQSPGRQSQGQWSPLDLKNVEIVTSSPTLSQQPEVLQASREAQVAAEQAVRQGFELAQRRAHYSARAKFMSALRIVAHSLDDQSNCTDHARSLRNALRAYEEVNDFFPHSQRPDQDVNLHVVIGGHDTEILQDVDSLQLTPSHCLREYLAYAEQELAAALSNDPLASQALYGLGRLEAAVETTTSHAEQVRAYRSLTLYQAALTIDSQNFAAANELGVSLARYEKYEAAITALRHCVRLSPQATAWTNLARIHEKLGQAEEARLAQAEATRATGRNPQLPFAANRPRVEWVDTDTFVNVPQVPGASTAFQQPTNPTPHKPHPRQVPVRTAKQTKRPWFFNFGK